MKKGLLEKDLSIISLIILIFNNIILLPVTFTIVIEQIKYGVGTQLEIGVLIPYILHILSLGPIIFGIIMISKNIINGNMKSKHTISLFIILALLIIQIALFHILIIF